MKNNILVLGYFGYVTDQIDGQTIKTRNIYNLLESKKEFVDTLHYFDTQRFKYNKFSIINMFWKIFCCNKLVYLPAHNNLNYIFPLIFFICYFMRIKILYFVVGGWLADYLKKKPIHAFLLKRIYKIFSESKEVRKKLIVEYGFENVEVFPNFRIHSFVPSMNINKNFFKIVFMARINRMKGLESVFRLATDVERYQKSNRLISIDFYGPLDEKDKDYFLKEIEKFNFVSYKGILAPEMIYHTLENYDLSILPTRYLTEGFPGTILDSYISGVPVVVSRWNYASEFVDHGKTGYIFDLDKEEKFYDYVEKIYNNNETLIHMKKNAFEKSKSYSSESAWHIIDKYISDVL